MSKYYFPSMLDDFEKQSVLSEQSVVPTLHLIEGVNTVQKMYSKHK